MSVQVQSPAKRVLADSTNKHRNPKVVNMSPSAKRRKLDIGSAPTLKTKGPNYGSSQPKSQFEEEVLEKLSQNIDGLKGNAAEKDQQWDRPPLNNFDEKTNALIFQQIDAEEGTLHGGRTTIRLFGVTEVRAMHHRYC